MDRFKRTEIKYQDPNERINNFNEVCYGYTEEECIIEAKRCLQCKNPQCVKMCPVNIDIPAFIHKLADNNPKEAAEELFKYTTLPAVCGRVCPQESQCEMTCILGRKGEPIAIGKLERYAGDYALKNGIRLTKNATNNGKKVAVVGSGPSGITCSADLAKLGYDVTMLESLHEAGGVLTYGIPEFRLPKDAVVKREIENIKSLGVKIKLNTIVGRTVTVDELLDEYDAVFIGTGAGLPVFMNIPGENYNGVFSANEYLTRTNLMKAYLEDTATPIRVGINTVVVGAGNVAMDAARTARRFGSNVTVVYRREDKDMPARREEIENAKEEGINFMFLTNPVEILADENGDVNKVRCIKMELGEPDASGRQRPVKIEGSEFEIEADVVIMALGTRPNPLIKETSTGIKFNEKGGIIVNEGEKTSRDYVYAGGDVVTGSATVIEAMGAGKKAAKAIDEALSK